MKDRRMLLSTLWIFVMFNYLYADVVGLMLSENLKQFLAGSFGPVQINEWFLLGAGVLMEVAMVMIVLSRVLARRANRWANVIAAVIQTAALAGSFFTTSRPAVYYIFFAVVETACNVLIVWLALTWRDDGEAAIKNKTAA